MSILETQEIYQKGEAGFLRRLKVTVSTRILL